MSSAIQVAQSLGAQLRVIRTTELEKPEYATNPLNRCYFCKHELFDHVFRVRYNTAEDGSITAKLQVEPSEMVRLHPLATQLELDLRGIGFSQMMIDPIGYQRPKKAVNA